MNLTPLEKRLALRAISNAVDKYDAILQRIHNEHLNHFKP